MNAVTGKGSRVIAEPDEQQVEYHPGPLPAPRATALLAARGQPGSHSPRSAVIRPAATASTSDLKSRSFWSA